MRPLTAQTNPATRPRRGCRGCCRGCRGSRRGWKMQKPSCLPALSRLSRLSRLNSPLSPRKQIPPLPDFGRLLVMSIRVGLWTLDFGPWTRPLLSPVSCPVALLSHFVVPLLLATTSQPLRWLRCLLLYFCRTLLYFCCTFQKRTTPVFTGLFCRFVALLYFQNPPLAAQTNLRPPRPSHN